MQEYMLFLSTEEGYYDHLSREEQREHVKKISQYIDGLLQTGKLKGAQPLAMEGTVISHQQGVIKDGPYNESKEVIAGYFHIMAQDLDEAVAIAKANPVLAETEAKIEVRPIKSMEGMH